MIRAFAGLAATVLVMAAAPIASAQVPATSPGPLVRAGALRQVSPHVWIIPDENVAMVPNVGFIAGSRAVLVVDTGLGGRNGATVAAEAARLAKGRKLYLVTTHIHPEHDLGAGAFPSDVTVIRSADQVRDIEESGLQLAGVFASRSAINAELLKGAEYRKANQVFDREQVLDLGGLTVRLLAMGPNHTRGDTAIWVETDAVLFTGDIAMRAQPAFASPASSLGHWLESLDRLRALHPKVVVPSHGPTGDVGFIDGYRAYLTTVRDRAAALRREGKSKDATVEAVTAELRPRYPDAGRLAGAIGAAYAEAK